MLLHTNCYPSFFRSWLCLRRHFGIENGFAGPQSCEQRRQIAKEKFAKRHNNHCVHIVCKRAIKSALVFCLSICYCVFSGHNLAWQGLCSQKSMNFVEPIRDRKKIAQIKNQLRGQQRYRDLLLFVVGINTTLRISDLLELRGEQDHGSK